ncbi:hypothetical protein [Arthrobacter sp. RCC_34]|uniref:hypothetical protein n=1 Tax=Arthrobacter sp. RCC_34 TaxID=3239230 RepID=UPI0035239563
MMGNETKNTDGDPREAKAEGSFGPLLIGVGLLVVALEAFVTSGSHPGVYVLGALLVLVGCTERLRGALRGTQDAQRPAKAPAREPIDR